VSFLSSLPLSCASLASCPLRYLALSPLSASSAASTLSISRAPSGAGVGACSVVATSDEAAAATTLLLGGFLVVAARVVLTVAPSPLVAAGVRAPRCCCFFREAAATAGAEVVVAGVVDEGVEEEDAAAAMGLLAALRATQRGATAPPRESVAAEETVLRIEREGFGLWAFLLAKERRETG